MDALCKILDALKVPQVVSLQESDASKQQLPSALDSYVVKLGMRTVNLGMAVSACELACGGSCPSAAEQDRALDQSYLTWKKQYWLRALKRWCHQCSSSWWFSSFKNCSELDSVPRCPSFQEIMKFFNISVHFSTINKLTWIKERLICEKLTCHNFCLEHWKNKDPLKWGLVIQYHDYDSFCLKWQCVASKPHKWNNIL